MSEIISFLVGGLAGSLFTLYHVSWRVKLSKNYTLSRRRKRS